MSDDLYQRGGVDSFNIPIRRIIFDCISPSYPFEKPLRQHTQSQISGRSCHVYVIVVAFFEDEWWEKTSTVLAMFHLGHHCWESTRHALILSVAWEWTFTIAVALRQGPSRNRATSQHGVRRPPTNDSARTFQQYLIVTFIGC